MTHAHKNSMEGKYMATVKVGTKGQIVIPKEARNMFQIEPGETLLLLADVDRGIAIVKNDAYLEFANSIFSVQPKSEQSGNEESTT